MGSPSVMGSPCATRVSGNLAKKIGSGGALTRLPGGIEALQSARGTSVGDALLPPKDARCVLDRDYVFACCGALLGSFERAAVVELIRRSIGADEEGA